MGYCAPSAENVYRFALRLDGPRSLVDRFGFSIVLVNDNSRTCREFLQRYCIDLCQRTADRIRFVFFSEVPEGLFEQVAKALNQGRLDPRRGMLRQIMSFIGSRFDYEEEPWRALRPSSLRPLGDLEEVEQRLSWQCDLHTAMPGTGIAMQFAQRLGIGRSVPCIVVFTEIGELYVDLLPMNSLSADQAFAHVRAWIDGFYEENRTLIDHWQTVETKIQQLARGAGATLEQIRCWRDERLEDWRHLSVVSNLIYEVELGDPSAWRAAAERLKKDYRAPRAARDILSWVADSTRVLERQWIELEAIDAAVGEIEAAANSEHFREVLPGLREKLPSSIATPTLGNAIRSVAESQNQSPRNELRGWWFRSGALKLSYSRYKQARKAWASLPMMTRPKHREEYRIVLGAIGQLPLLGDSNRGTDAVLSALAQCIGVDATSDAFGTATAGFRAVVREFLQRAGAHAPSWLLTASPDATVGDTVPLGEDLSPGSKASVFAERPILREALAKARVRGDSELARQQEQLALGWREEVLGELRSAAAARRDVEEARESIREKAVVQLQAVRRRVEADVLSLTGHGLELQRSFDSQLASRLHEALDEYDLVTTSIAFPHHKDALVRRVPIAVPVTRAAGVEADAEEAATTKLRSVLVQATDDDAKAPAAREQALEQAHSASPASRLEKALRSCLKRERFKAVVPDLDRLVAEHRVPDVLRSLDLEEIQNVALALNCSATPDGILIALGLYAGSPAGRDDVARVLAAKVRADDFDVFMAHNSRDKDTVLEIARQLRRVGIHPWIDIEQIPPGQWFQDAIQKVIPRVRAAAIFLGANGIGRWQVLELRAFVSQCVERGLPVIPVMLPGVETIPPDLVFLRELHAVRFPGPSDAEALAQLQWGITGEHRASV